MLNLTDSLFNAHERLSFDIEEFLFLFPNFYDFPMINILRAFLRVPPTHRLRLQKIILSFKPHTSFTVCAEMQSLQTSVRF